MIRWVDMEFLRVRNLGPQSLDSGHTPQSYLDIAPFPLWLVPPAWRCARMSDITTAVVHWQEQQPLQEPLPLTLQTLPQWFERLDVGWNHEEPLLEWKVREPSEVIIVWGYGARRSMSTTEAI